MSTPLEARISEVEQLHHKDYQQGATPSRPIVTAAAPVAFADPVGAPSTLAG